MKKELKSGILSADKSADCRPTVGGANVIAVLYVKLLGMGKRNNVFGIIVLIHVNVSS